MFRSFLTLLIVFTGASCLQVAFLPRLPAAEDPELDLEGIQGAQAVFVEELPRRQTLDWSLSPTRRYSLHFLEDGPSASGLSLSLTGVTVRREKHLQVALVTQGDPGLEMDRRRLYQTRDGDQVAIGTIGGLSALQSCEVPAGGSGVTQEALAQLTPHKPFYRQDIPSLVRRLAGLQSHRNHDCLLITITSPVKGEEDHLIASWRKVLKARRNQIPSEFKGGSMLRSALSRATHLPQSAANLLTATNEARQSLLTSSSAGILHDPIRKILVRPCGASFSRDG